MYIYQISPSPPTLLALTLYENKMTFCNETIFNLMIHHINADSRGVKLRLLNAVCDQRFRMIVVAWDVNSTEEKRLGHKHYIHSIKLFALSQITH